MNSHFLIFVDLSIYANGVQFRESFPVALVEGYSPLCFLVGSVCLFLCVVVGAFGVEFVHSGE